MTSNSSRRRPVTRVPAADGPVVVAGSVPAQWGPVHAAATADGVVAVELMATREAFAAGLERRLRRPVRWPGRGGAPVAGAPPAVESGGDVPLDDPAAVLLAEALDAIEEALSGDEAAREALRRLPVDLRDRPAWDRAVLGAVREIPPGEVRSYGDIARAIGRPGAARAVGGAVGRNPVGLLIPCHRVVAGDGTLGGYGGGGWGDRERLVEVKAELLAREGVSLPRSQVGRRTGRRGALGGRSPAVRGR